MIEFVTEEEMHAYIDGALDPTRRAALGWYLARHPLEAARMEAFRAQCEGLHALYDEVLEQPVPPRFLRLFHATRYGVWRRRLGWALAAAGGAAMLMALGGEALHEPLAWFGPGASLHPPTSARQDTDTVPMPMPPAVPPRRSSSGIGL